MIAALVTNIIVATGSFYRRMHHIVDAAAVAFNSDISLLVAIVPFVATFTFDLDLMEAFIALHHLGK
jgi:hypothetical protein